MLDDEHFPLPLVSVIIRSMGRPTLHQALDSVAAQRYPHLELVVVNAKGVGHAALAEYHGRIPLRFCDDHQPLKRSRAANRGMEQAQGVYLLFLDDDDWLLPEHISALVAALQQQPHLRVAYAGVECIREEPDGSHRPVLVYNQPFDALRLLYENYLPIHAVLFERRFYLEGCRFDESLDIYEDWDFWLQLRVGGPFGHLDRVGAIYRLNPVENLGSAAHGGLQIPAWEAILHKWRDHWSDYELRQICTRAKHAPLANQQARQEAEQAHQEAEQARQEAAQAHQETEQARAEADALKQMLEQEQDRNQQTVSSLYQRIEVLAERLVRQHKDLETVTAGLAAIEASATWRATYPYRWLMSRVRAGLQPTANVIRTALPTSAPVACPPNPHPIDVIIPVYRGLAETRACLDSVLATVPDELGQIIVINDASPEPEITAWLEQQAKIEPRLILLSNAKNLGFVQTCNRGMALHPERDVVLLNSDTEVANDWLSRLQSSACQDRRIGTVTPFSNNATICSYPRFCMDNTLPAGWSVAELDALFSRCNRGEWTDIPTAIGFCMYIRRECLNETGYFDERHFGKGYGEENDFSMRAKALGWRHILCADVFVYHAGSVSFADQQNHRKRQALQVLNRLHPDYESLVHRHIAQDPARSFRLRVDLARLKRSDVPVVLLITHDRGGGTQRHIEELAGLFSDTLHFLVLRPGGNGQYRLSWLRSGEALELIFKLPEDFDSLIEGVQALAVQRLHFHHTIGLHPLLLGLPERLGVSYDFTAHDYYSCCPQISLTHYQNHYCGEPDEAGCNRCLAILPVPGSQSIQAWRQRYTLLIGQADRVLAPSADAARRFARYFPDARIYYAPHPEPGGRSGPPPSPVPLLPGSPLRIAVLGALSPIKGADLLEQCASDAWQRDLPLTFHLLGYAYRDLHRPPQGVLSVHGPYDDAELAALISALQPHLVWFPAQWPETYSYTLSTCLHQGLPVVVPDLGAFPERVAGRPWSWVCAWQQSPRAWNDFFIQIREQNFARDCSPPLPLGRPVEFPAFDYRQDYRVAGDRRLPSWAPSRVDAVMSGLGRNFACPRLTAADRSKAVLRMGLLDIVVRLRRAPMLGWAVRRIPLGWQTRVKTWLRGTSF